MERLAVSRTEATCPGANSRFLPQLLMYHMELSWNTNKVRLRPARSIHTPSSMNGNPIKVITKVKAASKGVVLLLILLGFGLILLFRLHKEPEETQQPIVIVREQKMVAVLGIIQWGLSLVMMLTAVIVAGTPPFMLPSPL